MWRADLSDFMGLRAESQKDSSDFIGLSDIMDFFRLPLFNFVKSRNDDSLTPSLRGQQLAEIICSLSSLRGFAKAEAIHKENPLIETTKSQGDSVESTKDSSIFDLQVWASCYGNSRHANSCGLSHKDAVVEIPRKTLEYRKDEKGTIPHALQSDSNNYKIITIPQSLAKQERFITKTTALSLLR